MENKFKWAVIGTGSIANIVCSQLQKSKRHQIISCYSRTKLNRDKFAKKFGAKSCESMKEAVLTQGVDGVYIATPHGYHYEQLMEILDYGKPIICEKSFTLNAKEAEAVFEKAEKNNVYVCEAMWTYFNPNSKRLVKMIENCDMGKLISIDARFGANHKMAKKEGRLFENEAGGGAILDLGVYPISFSYLMCGKRYPDEVVGELKVENEIDIDGKYKLSYGDVTCNLSSSFCGGLGSQAKLTFEKGTVYLPSCHVPIVLICKYKSGKLKIHTAKGGYLHEFDTVASEVRKGMKKSEVVSPTDTLNVMKIMDEIRFSNEFYYNREMK